VNVLKSFPHHPITDNGSPLVPDPVSDVSWATDESNHVVLGIGTDLNFCVPVSLTIACQSTNAVEVSNLCGFIFVVIIYLLKS